MRCVYLLVSRQQNAGNIPLPLLSSKTQSRQVEGAPITFFSPRELSLSTEMHGSEQSACTHTSFSLCRLMYTRDQHRSTDL